jgi:5-methyltetrahydrofolate--homocysteine methyltransferase
VLDHIGVRGLRGYIDWTPFFQAWELAGKYPAILADPVVGTEAAKLFADAEAMLDRIETERLLTPRAVVGIFPAASVGDDIQVFTDESRTDVRAVIHGLRQQFAKVRARTSRCRISWLRPLRGERIGSARSPSPWRARRSWRRSSRGSTTTTARSW